jgi:hypothetical protein
MNIENIAHPPYGRLLVKRNSSIITRRDYREMKGSVPEFRPLTFTLDHRLPSPACPPPANCLLLSTLASFVSGRYAQVRRALVIPTNLRTAAQLSVREIFTSVAKRWPALTQEQRNAWIAAAEAQKSKSRLGQSGPPTGSQLFVLFYWALLCPKAWPSCTATGPKRPAGRSGRSLAGPLIVHVFRAFSSNPAS